LHSSCESESETKEEEQRKQILHQLNQSSSSTSTSTSTSTSILADIKAYAQQTPHSGRHFLPSHPFYHSKRKNEQKLKRKKIKSFLYNRLINPIRRPPYRIVNKRFMEGWYYRITLPQQQNQSFAFMFSIEDPQYEYQINKKKSSSSTSLSAVQVMGPNDEYIVQCTNDTQKFWAHENCQAYGCTFEYKNKNTGYNNGNDNNDYYANGNGNALLETSTSTTSPAIHPDEFYNQVQSGFQMLPTRLQGIVDGHDGSLGGVHPNQGVVCTCDFDIQIHPLSGWGDDPRNDDEDDYKNGQITQKRKRQKSTQKSTAGWLASYSVFEPHWQVTLADARATGHATWNGTRYEFENIPFYGEKNWGGSFPSKWYWVQCNSFHGYTPSSSISSSNDDYSNNNNRLSVTAGGGVRKTPFGEENLGMISIHYNGIFYENVPWTGEMEWETTWGKWNFIGRCTSGERLFEVEVEAECDPQSGLLLRVPKANKGLDYGCRDSFAGKVRLSLYELRYDQAKKEYVRSDKTPIIDNATSDSCAVEIGGGSYHDTWKAKSRMNKILKTFVRLPYLFKARV